VLFAFEPVRGNRHRCQDEQGSKTMTSFTDRLAAARLDGTTVSVGQEEGPIDAVAAYAMQAEVFKHLGPASHAWKVGSTSPESQAKLGTNEPGAARVPARFNFDSGEDAPVFATHDLWIEGEFALRLGSDLPPRVAEYTRDEVVEAIDGVAPALEVVGSRLAEGIAKGGRFRVTADGGANVTLTTGAVFADWRRFDLPNHALHLSINGSEVAVGIGERALGDPVNVMIWLANHQRSKDGLKAGELVSTGTCTGLIRVVPGDLLRADFGEIGTVEARLTGAGA
jgi:2-keto-4-pentenoate hydratase